MLSIEGRPPVDVHVIVVRLALLRISADQHQGFVEQMLYVYARAVLGCVYQRKVQLTEDFNVTIVMTIVLSGHLIVQQETIKASEFKAKCLQLMDEVKATGKEIIITKNGEPVSKLVPFKKRPKTLFGAHKKVVNVHGDIISSLDEEWEAMK